MSSELKVVPRWPEPARCTMYSTLMRQASAKAAARSYGLPSSVRMPLQLGRRDIPERHGDDLPHSAAARGHLGGRALEVLGVVDREALVPLGEERRDPLARDCRALALEHAATTQSRGSSSATRPGAGTGYCVECHGVPGSGRSRSGRIRSPSTTPHLPRVLAARARRRGSSRRGRRARGSAPTRAGWSPRCGTGSSGAGSRTRPRRGRSCACSTHSMSGDIGSAISAGRSATVAP